MWIHFLRGYVHDPHDTQETHVHMPHTRISGQGCFQKIPRFLRLISSNTKNRYLFLFAPPSSPILPTFKGSYCTFSTSYRFRSAYETRKSVQLHTKMHKHTRVMCVWEGGGIRRPIICLQHTYLLLQDPRTYIHTYRSKQNLQILQIQHYPTNLQPTDPYIPTPPTLQTYHCAAQLCFAIDRMLSATIFIDKFVRLGFIWEPPEKGRGVEFPEQIAQLLLSKAIDGVCMQIMQNQSVASNWLAQSIALKPSPLKPSQILNPKP